MPEDHEGERPTNAPDPHSSTNSSPLQDSQNAVRRVKRRPNRWTLLGLAVTAAGLVGVFLPNASYDSPDGSWVPATTMALADRLNPITCSQAGSLRSREAKVATRIEIINQSSRVILIYWVDYEGEYKFYGNLGPTQSKVFDTFLTQPWLITDPVGNCLSIFFPDPKFTQAVVSDPGEGRTEDVTTASLRTQGSSSDPLQTASFVVTALGLAVAVLSWLAPTPFRKGT
jgi:hypothetical protein